MLSSVAWAFVFAVLVERVLGGARVRYARITYIACAVAFLGLAFVSLGDLWSSTVEARAGVRTDRDTHVLPAAVPLELEV